MPEISVLYKSLPEFPKATILLLSWDPFSLASKFLLLILTHLLSALSKDLIKIVLEPSNIRAQPSKLPLPIHLLVPMSVRRVRMALDSDGTESLVGIFLVRNTQLMPAHDLCV